MAHTHQERVDQLTMQITNPNVIGSGYIEHPPQRPFADRILVQPPTINPDDIPEWFDSSKGAYQGGGRGYGGTRGGRGYGGQGSYHNSGRGRNGPPQHRNGGAPHGYNAYGHTAGVHPAQTQQYRPPVHQQQQQQNVRPPQHYQGGAPRPVQPRPPASNYGASNDASSLLNSLQQTAAPAAPAAPAPVEAAPQEKTLSKSAKAKLRKKLREGKI